MTIEKTSVLYLSSDYGKHLEDALITVEPKVWTGSYFQWYKSSDWYCSDLCIKAIGWMFLQNSSLEPQLLLDWTYTFWTLRDIFISSNGISKVYFRSWLVYGGSRSLWSLTWRFRAPLFTAGPKILFLNLSMRISNIYNSN